MVKVTETTKGVWLAVQELWDERGISPTYAEIGERAHLAVSNVSAHLSVLMAGGVLVWDFNKPRSIRLLKRLKTGQPKTGNLTVPGVMIDDTAPVLVIDDVDERQPVQQVQVVDGLMSDHEARVYRFVKSMIERVGHGPGVDDVMSELYMARSAARTNLGRLCEGGWLRQDRHGYYWLAD